MARFKGEKTEKPTPPRFPGAGVQSKFANQYFIHAGPILTRFAFGEQVEMEKPILESTFTMPTDVAKGFAETILRLIANTETAKH